MTLKTGYTFEWFTITIKASEKYEAFFMLKIFIKKNLYSYLLNRFQPTKSKKLNIKKQLTY